MRGREIFLKGEKRRRKGAKGDESREHMRRKVSVELDDSGLKREGEHTALTAREEGKGGEKESDDRVPLSHH